MQTVLEKAAQWYLGATNFDIPEVKEDLKLCLQHRAKAMESGRLSQIYRTFAAVEITKAALCILLNHEYPTAFSDFELAHIHALTGLPMPKALKPKQRLSGRINSRGEIICNP